MFACQDKLTMKHSAHLCHSYFKLSNHKQLRPRVKDLCEPVKTFADHLLKMASHAIHYIYIYIY